MPPLLAQHSYLCWVGGQRDQGDTTTKWGETVADPNMTERRMTERRKTERRMNGGRMTQGRTT
jgi:hypothetical protein